MFTPPSLPGQAEAAPAEVALILASHEGETATPQEVSLNPLGEWVIVLAWAALVAINLWTWRTLLKRRPAPSEGI